MAVQKWQLLLVVGVLVQVCPVAPSQEIMHKLTKGFVSAFEQCKQEVSDINYLYKEVIYITVTLESILM